jgi:protein-S-isoprenylcysteine O-methyltransferase Ste14
MMVISVVSLAAFSWFLISVWREAQPVSPRLAGLGLQTASLALFLAAIRATRGARLRVAFDRGQSIALIDTGPYRYVRHPFYLSYTLFWIGCAAATISPISVLFAAVLVGLYATAAYVEEKRFLASSLSEQYADYRRRTGSLWPWT